MHFRFVLASSLLACSCVRSLFFCSPLESTSASPSEQLAPIRVRTGRSYTRSPPQSIPPPKVPPKLGLTAQVSKRLPKPHMPPPVDDLKIGPRAIVAQDAKLSGDVTIGAGCVVHPKATIIALNGPIILGPNNIIEELSVIVNRRKHIMMIGPSNLFAVGSRVEALSIGSHNIFEPKSRVSTSILVANYTVVGAGCTVVASAEGSFPPVVSDFQDAEEEVVESPVDEVDRLPERTVVFGLASERRVRSKEGDGQAEALHVKHLQCLAEMLPKLIKLKQPVGK